MQVEVIAVGNEIITGSTINSNATYISKELQTIGFRPRWHTSVGDNIEDINDALDISLKRAEVIVFTGGLGPTEDDLTKETVCKALTLDLVLDKDILEGIRQRFEKMGRKMPDSNKKQACFPGNQIIIPNDHGTAPGCIIKVNQQYIVLLPGPPKEMRPMLQNTVIPFFKDKLKQICYQEEIKVFGIGESHLVELIGEHLKETSTLIVAPYIGKNEIIIRVTSYEKTLNEAQCAVKKVVKMLSGRIAPYIIGYNEDTLEKNIVDRLIELGHIVATSESCTGGLLAATLINVNGVSSCYKEGVITYSNHAKEKYLDVECQTLQKYGAVSKEVAIQMARGIRNATGATIGLSTTGIAGPGGGTPTKPVGLVYIGISMGEVSEVHELRLSGTREEIREKTVKYVLYYLHKLLK